MSVILIIIIVILVLYFIRRSCNYSSKLIEGLTNDDKPKDVKQFVKSISNWEKNSVKFVDTEVTDLNKLANSLTSGLDFKSNCGNYENILIDFESFFLYSCIFFLNSLIKLFNCMFFFIY